MRMTRRQLIRTGALGTSAFLLPWSRRALALPSQDKTLVVLFLRGGADGINFAVPRGDEANYNALRNNPTTGVDITLPPAGPELQLDGFFELNPGLALLKGLYDSGDLCLMHAVGGTNDYSHFTAEDAMERAEPNSPQLVSDGWLHRALGVMHDQACLDGPVLALHGVALGSVPPDSLAGISPEASIATTSLADFTLSGDFVAERTAALERIYGASTHPLLGGVGSAALSAKAQLEAIAGQPPGAGYATGNTALNTALADAARLIKNPSLRTKIVTIDYRGWDHHSNLFTRLETNCTELATGLSEFWLDLGSDSSRTVVLVVTEFGRTAHANGTGGTDHGHGTVMLALGGPVMGGRVLTRADPAAPGTGISTPFGHWPGLGPGELHVQPSSGQQRDLKATTDFRDVFGDVLVNFLGLPTADVQNTVLRGYTPTYPGLF